MLRFLPPVIPPPPGDNPSPGGPDHPMRKVTIQVASSPDGWTAERKQKVAELFDALAPDWHERVAELGRGIALADAYERGDVPAGGVCLELGSGTGANTPFLAERHDVVLAADLSAGMLREAPDASPRLQTDSSQLPFADGTIDAVVLVNMFLFPAECDRVLAPDGRLAWVNTAGDRTPIHLKAEEVDAFLPGEWEGVHSEAAWGTWAVFRRAR